VALHKVSPVPTWLLQIRGRGQGPRDYTIVSVLVDNTGASAVQFRASAGFHTNVFLLSAQDFFSPV